jgi:transcriptional regulator with XRE-family HTH domain
MTIGENIKKYRKDKKITQKQLAELINKNDRTIQKYEKGDIIPPMSVIKEIANILDTAMINLIGHNEELSFKAHVDGFANDVDSYYKSPSDVNLEKEMDEMLKAVEDMLSNEYIEKEYGYKYNKLSFDDQSELYGFMHKMLKIKIDEIKLRKK